MENPNNLQNENGYSQPSHTNNNEDGELYGVAVASMIIGIIGILLLCVPLLGVISNITAIIMGFTAKSRNTHNMHYKGKAFIYTGLTTGFIGLSINSVILIIYLLATILAY